MRSLDLIPARWVDYEPPGLCHTGIEELLAVGVAGAAEAATSTGIGSTLSTIGTVASIAGTGVQAISAMQQSDYEAAVARNQALVQQQKANEDAALGQRAAITESRKAQLVQSRAQAVAAASGTDAASPSTVDLESNIAQQGSYNALSALYEGMARSRGDTEQASIDLFKADRAEAAGPWAAAGSLFSGAGRTLSNPGLLKLLGGA